MSASFIRVLEQSRKDLLDLSARNRLVHTPLDGSRIAGIRVVNGRPDQIFERLRTERKPITFEPKLDDNRSRDDLVTFDVSSVANSDASQNADGRLQTEYDAEGLQKRLLKIYYDAQAFEEEQGVNALYLAIGFLRWYEDEKSDKARTAPLVLAPVSLERQSANTRFVIRLRDEDLFANISLQARLFNDFGINLPDLPDFDERTITEYFNQVRTAITSFSRWQVEANRIQLGFFSFSKFLMYRDLHSESWPADKPLGERGLIRSTLTEGFRDNGPLIPDSGMLDQLLSVRETAHVMDADSSQLQAIEEVRRNRNLVIQGPPGTGKSQTICNIIAAAVADGKKVLFVAEKMAALEVVRERLCHAGLGPICLELHSRMANKKAVLDELRRTLELGRPKIGNSDAGIADLTRARDILNEYVRVLHAPLKPCEWTPFELFGTFARLHARGLKKAAFRLEEAAEWDADKLRKFRGLVEGFAVALSKIGDPTRHSWKGVQIDVLLPMDRQSILDTIGDTSVALDLLRRACERLAKPLKYSVPACIAEVRRLDRIVEHLLQAPPSDAVALRHEVWTTRRSELDRLVDEGCKFDAIRAKLSGLIVDAAWKADAARCRRILFAHRRNWFRALSREYRSAIRIFDQIAPTAKPMTAAERVEVLDALIAGQQAACQVESLGATDDLAIQAFGKLWKGLDTDWQLARAIVSWEQQGSNERLPHFRHALKRVMDTNRLMGERKQLHEQLARIDQGIKRTAETLRLDMRATFSHGDIEYLPFVELEGRLGKWISSPDGLGEWVVYFRRASEMTTSGLGPIVEAVLAGRASRDGLLDQFDFAACEAIARMAFRQYPILAEFDGSYHSRTVQHFCKYDLEQKAIASARVAFVHHERLPIGRGIGEIGLLYAEMEKKRRHLPLRQLLKLAGTAIQSIKPVFMMSPISVAQFLEAGQLEFDLLLIDEASQVKPVDALGAIARSNQLVVVGDDRQMPPTAFFDQKLGDDLDDESDDDDSASAKTVSDIESILGLCRARGVPQRMLRWHYRSRHHSLIAVSNREFYDSRLFIVPSPEQKSKEYGLRFHHIANGVYDRGGTRANAIEAQAVARAVFDHARQFPTKSLGVGAFSVAQRDAILNELELLRQQASDAEHFFSRSAKEPFFVKNLEMLQGDERDVIFVSVGYGKDPGGYTSMTFGPLSQSGGERRLNVLITRARERCEVFSSILPDEIDLARATSRGAGALKCFLKYAHTGILGNDVVTDREPDSEFELQVARAIRTLGFDVVAQVGVAGFFIDLAVVDPEVTGRYAIGIECDGASYHSSRSARDRDRLRQGVLEARGWKLHRIWSTDWFKEPDKEIRKLAAAIEDALLIAGRGDASALGEVASNLVEADSRLQRTTPEPSAPIVVYRDEIDHEGTDLSKEMKVRPYEVAQLTVIDNTPFSERSLEQRIAIITFIVKVEAPIHSEEIGRRVATLMGAGRTGSRIMAAVRETLGHAVGFGHFSVQNEFYVPVRMQDIPIRDRTDAPQSVRKPEMLPPAEIANALTQIVRLHAGADLNETVVQTSRILGFRSTSTQLRKVISQSADQLIERGELIMRGSKLHVPSS